MKGEIGSRLIIKSFATPGSKHTKALLIAKMHFVTRTRPILGRENKSATQEIVKG